MVTKIKQNMIRMISMTVTKIKMLVIQMMSVTVKASTAR
ncbi:hypothetical protein PC129_g3069 [Phytophthora cactorum]|uniref:Uncharacterized protein n=1 Tax=Phytophthora cactorum TaxID=29920 RepID=A0A8T1DE84_9STRA|nr:hypothetical protein Pcac1_g536 [Phytophthora cactorum]KAG2923006.1 hypothetical protein PC114_g4984 [Phytophthora cactorum]KAG2937352.1 hypothetical protein PC115_g4244 [Phytophthora cactorum]KAG2950031.1 hypothetical protein PC117_g4732 [Phytophthora cactorum]KAG3035652.1 hypothetical protein PC119_g4528 [Phytophthora cactorum]